MILDFFSLDVIPTVLRYIVTDNGIVLYCFFHVHICYSFLATFHFIRCHNLAPLLSLVVKYILPEIYRFQMTEIQLTEIQRSSIKFQLMDDTGKIKEFHISIIEV